MAKFRFPGKALKLNTRKRVRFRGRYPNNTPEELYTRRIRRGLDLFHKLFGDSDEDEDEFEGFTNGLCKEKKSVPTHKPKAAEKKVDEVCSSLEKEGLVRRTRTSAVAMAVKEVREGKEKKAQALDERTRVKTPPVDGKDKEGDASEKAVPESAVVTVPNVVVPLGRRNRVPIIGHSAHKQTNCRMGRQPTVKTALAKKLLAKAKKKLPSLPVVGEKSPKRFILPTMSARSSRIIKPNKRLFADITEMCSTSSSVELKANAEVAESKNSLSLSSKRLVKLRKSRPHTRLFRSHGSSTLKGSEGVGRDRMRRTISLYTEAITGPCRGQVGRPPKRMLRRLEAPQQEVVEGDVPESPQKCDLKESRVKEKIEKLLRSPWDDRLKQSGKGGKGEVDEMMPAPASTTSPALSAFSRNILRKARLNLNKSTLQKIRNPDSLQRLIPQSDEGKVEGKCVICDRDEGENTRKFGVTICEMCCSFVSSASDGPKEIFECLDTKGLCQIQGLEEEERCLACWLGRILQTCFMPNILHDRLRKRLPPPLKERIPTSLARCMNLGSSAAATENDSELTSHTKRLPLDPGGAGGGGGGGGFGNVMDLPGGWRRKTGSEVVVISPSGEKFRSMQKLEEYLKNQGICADARVLFGNSSSVVGKTSEGKSRPVPSTKSSKRSRVVMTTLPGGWTRRIKWRSAGDKFDTYVFSPDGRTFRSKRELSAYFQAIGKIDDIHKYFPVVNGNSDSSTPSSSDNTCSSSTEPVSSSEIGSDISSDDKSPEASEVEFETPKSEAPKILSKSSKVKIKSSKIKSGDRTESPKIPDLKVDSKKLESSNAAAAGDKVIKSYPDQPSTVATDDDDDEGVHRSSSRQSVRADGSEDVSSGGRTNEIENYKNERKPKKKGLRTRSLLLTSKHRDTSHTDTTESESEQRVAKEETVFTRAFIGERGKMLSSVSEMESPEKKGLCSAWNTVLCDTGGNDFESYTSKSMDERKRSMKTLDRKRETSLEESDHFAVPNLVPDSKANTEKVVLKISKNSLTSHTPFEEPNKDRARERSIPGVFEQEEETSGVVSQASTAESPTPLLVRKKSLSGGLEQEEDYGTEDESHDSAAESFVSSLTKTGSSNIKSIISRVSKTRPKLKKKTSMYESVQFGSNWSRKIKWNEKGEGKVALLHSPDGQTIRSRIELLAYFKKAGVTKVDLDYYFPPNLKRGISSMSSLVPNFHSSNSVSDNTMPVAAVGSGHSSEASDISDSEGALKTSEDSSASMEDGRRRRRVITDYSRLGRTLDVSSKLVDGVGRVPHLARSGKKIIVVTGKSGKIPIIKNEAEEPPVVLPEPGGPRVKHVCRSQAQVLKGIQRAVFPSPEKDGKEDLDSSSPIIESKKKRKREVVTVMQRAASGKILQKTMWCNKCTGCITPNCQKCVNCLDMKKFGGPGTKKKPCIKRKCLNPRLSAKSAQSALGQDRKFKRTLPLATTNEPVEAKERPRSPAVQEEKSLSKPDIPEEKTEIDIRVSMHDKSSVFVPRQMTRVQPDQKDRCDIAAGKKFVPGALVNIDYWQGYDVDEMMLSGFSVTTSSPLYPQTLCFRCGSAGKERLIFCIWCCEGVHPFCMEDGEGPESDTEEMLWICRRCAVCHVCGAPGADSLLRCSDCRNYYHMECLGPSAHSTCQPSPDRPWEAEMMIHLRHSWPLPAVLYDAQSCGETGLTDAVVMLTELDVLKDADEVFDDDFDEPDIHFLPVGDNQEKQVDKEAKSSDDFDLDDAICLEDSIIEVFRNIDLHKSQSSVIGNLHGKEVLTLATADEYLCLGYKKLIEYASKKIEISYYRLLQIIHNELFDTLGYPTWKEMLRKGLVEEKRCLAREDSETDTASEGDGESEESDWDWEDILEFRRFEAAQEMQEREEKRLEEERKEKEKEKQIRLARRKELEKDCKAKEPGPGQKPKIAINVKKKKRRGRPPGTLNKPREGVFDFIVPDDTFYNRTSLDDQETPKRIKIRQPKSWEEFDRLFFKKIEENCEIKTEDLLEDDELRKEEEEQNLKVKKKKTRVLLSTADSEKVKGRKKIGKVKMKGQRSVRGSTKILKKLKGLNMKKKSKNLQGFKGRCKKLLKSQDKSKVILKKGRLKNKKLSSASTSVLSKRKLPPFEGNQDKSFKKRKKETPVLQKKCNQYLKKQRGKVVGTEEDTDMLKFVEDTGFTNQKNSSDGNGKDSSSAIQKRLFKSEALSFKGVRHKGKHSHPGQGKVDSVVRNTKIRKRKKSSSAELEKTKDVNEDEVSHNKIYKKTDKVRKEVEDYIDSPHMDVKFSLCDLEDVLGTECDQDGDYSEFLTDDEETDFKSDSGGVSRRQQKVFSVPSFTDKSHDLPRKLTSSCKPEEENSDKENLPRIRKIEKVLQEEREGMSKLCNGLADEASVIDISNTDAKCSDNDDEAFISEGALESVPNDKKRKFETFLEESIAKSDCEPKGKISKKGGSTLDNPKSDEGTPSCSGSLASGRRRRSVGRASQLASQRKAMMDY